MRYVPLKKIAVAFFLSLFSCSAFAQSATRFVVSQYDNGAGLKIQYIFGFRSAECNRLISTIEASLRVDCPNCTRDYAGCIDDLGDLEAVWRNESYIFPYLTTGNVRNILSGYQRTQLIGLCEGLAESHRAIGRQALCVH